MSPTVFAVSVTPFTDDGALDEDALRRHLRHLAGHELGIYVAGGGSGEGHGLSAHETTRVLAIATDTVGSSVPVRAMGVGVRSSAEMIHLVGLAASAGAAAAQVYSPELAHGHRLAPDDLHRFFDEVLGSTSLPCVLSTHRSVGYTVPTATFVDLAHRHQHLIGFTVSQTLGYLVELIDALSAVGRPVEVHYGGDIGALDAMAAGAAGFLSSTANVAPQLVSTVGRLLSADDGPGLVAAYGRLVRIALALGGSAGVPELKAVLHALGHPVGPPRPPHTARTASQVAHLVELVRELGDEPD